MPEVVAAGRMTSSEAFPTVEEDDSTSNKKSGLFYDVYGPEVDFHIFFFSFSMYLFFQYFSTFSSGEGFVFVPPMYAMSELS